MMCELSYKEVLKLCQTNKELANKYIKNLYEKYNPTYKNLKIEKPLLSIMNFVPLPYKFETNYLDIVNKVEENNNKYIFVGTPGDRILFGNRRLPHYKTDAIPFTIPITLNNESRLIQSNIFYYEITLNNEYIRDSWDNECMSIGFGTKNINYKSQVGWSQNSWGFHSDDGKYVNKNNQINFGPPWKTGDIVGTGLIYESPNVYKLFLTINGIFINEEIDISSVDYIYPIIGFDLSKPIKVNWGTEEFMFDLEKYINCNYLLNNKNTFMTRNNGNLDDYEFKPNSQNNKYDSFKNIISLTSLLHNTGNNTLTTSPLFNSTVFNLVSNNIFDLSGFSISYMFNNNISSLSPISVYSSMNNLDISYNDTNMLPIMYTYANNLDTYANNLDTSSNNLDTSSNNLDTLSNNLDVSSNNTFNTTPTIFNFINNKLFDISGNQVQYLVENDISYNLINNIKYVYSPIYATDSSNNYEYIEPSMYTYINNLDTSSNNLDTSSNNLDTSSNNLDTSSNK